MAFSTNLGYPRIGKAREFKKTIEAFWKEKISKERLHETLESIHADNLKSQLSAGIDLVPLGDFSAYDLMIETLNIVGATPKRFQNLSGWERYYAMARGTQSVTPCEMKKWFNTNYHYIVPEIEGDFSLSENRPLKLHSWAKSLFPSARFKLVLIGPYTFLKLSHLKNGKSFAENLRSLTKVYQTAIADLERASCEWLEMDEPSLCGDVDETEWRLFEETYQAIGSGRKGLKLLVQTYYGDVAPLFSKLMQLPIDGLGCDLVYGPKNKEAIQNYRGPGDKWLGLGLVDGRNVWKTCLAETLSELKTITQNWDHSKVLIHPSCSLLHLPLSLEGENHIPTVLKKRISFASDRLKEVVTLCRGFNDGAKSVEDELNSNGAAWKDREFVSFAMRPEVQKRVDRIQPEDFNRKSPFEKRLDLQQKDLKLPPLPTTTIGSFPQTAQIRQARSQWRKREISNGEYDRFIEEEIARVVKLQEEIGLDLLVHGEPERTDMVEYFGQQMKGFQFTENGWVQSYGTRCVRPPIIYGDVFRERPMTLKESKIAMRYTKKPMKGMLTGPVTILNWSFPRVDVPKRVSALQIAFALRDEVLDLEKNGVKVIQIDEPALREGLPLRCREWAEYLRWAVDSFKLCSSGVRDTTQIHSHMCYSEFSDILESIQSLDADVLSIEDSRSNGKLAKGFSEMHYRNGIGPGVYDVHSERIPPKEEFEKRIRFLVENIPLKQLWINPDCGLKTRGYGEVVPSLINMVAAVQKVRKDL